MSIHGLQTSTALQPAIALEMADRLRPRPDGKNWAQLLMLTLLLWVSLFYSGIGSAIGVPPDVVANRIEARMLAQMRHSGASQASRWAGVEQDVEMAMPAPTIGPPGLSLVPFVAALPPLDFHFAPNEQGTEQPLPAGLSAHVAQQWQVPLTRAPPFQALKT
nr:hypothetical protein [uncultured Rhodoferax sp.]